MNKITKISFIAGLCLCLSVFFYFNYANNQQLKKRNLSSLGAQLNSQVTKLVLDNGLSVLLYEDHTTPTLLTYVQWVKVGASDEAKKKTGYAHFFEHLLFKGTDTVSSKEFEITSSILGGRNNAFTSYDSTVYFMDLSSLQLEWAIKTEASRIKNLILFDPTKRAQAEAVINSERGAVVDEKIRAESSVSSLLFQEFFKTIFKNSNYEHAILGSMQDLNKATVEDFKAFYTKYYSPNNIVVAIGGDFDTKQAIKWIKQYYGKIKSSKINKIAFTPPKVANNIQIDFKEIQATKQLKNSKYKFKKVFQSQFIMGYSGVSIAHKDEIALDVLANILSGGPASRLDRILDTQKNLVNSIYAGHYSLSRLGAFYIGAGALPNVKLENIIAIIDQEIEDIQKNGVSRNELQVAKNQLQFAEIDELKTVHNKTMGLVTAEVFKGDYRSFFTQTTQYESISINDIQKVAKKYLTKNNRVLIRALADKEKNQ